MEFFKVRQTIPFMRYKFSFNIISIVTFIFSLFFIFIYGFYLSIEFTGGTIMEINCEQNISIDDIRKIILQLNYRDFHVQKFSSSNEFMIRLPTSVKGGNADMQGAIIINSLKENINSLIELRRTEFMGPQIGDELISNILKSLCFIVFGMIIYLGIRFNWKFAIAGVIANLHDIVVVLGLFAFFQWEFSLSTLSGVLTALGYSVNESIIIMDRIRENISIGKTDNFKHIINKSITQTISRTVITHFATQIMISSMLFFGGQPLHYFATALTIGIWIGIYSSIFVTGPFLIWIYTDKALSK